jgi:hypothetical protein
VKSKYSICVFAAILLAAAARAQQCSPSIASCQSPISSTSAAASECCQIGEKTTNGCGPFPPGFLGAALATLAITNPAAALQAGCLDINNPACGVNTAFSNYDGTNRTTAAGPCDNHDYCYSTCWAVSKDGSQSSHKSACDSNLYLEMLNVCAKAKSLGKDSQPVIDACNFFAGTYYVAVSDIPFVNRFAGDQSGACLCCAGPPPPGNPGCWTWSSTILENPLVGTLVSGYVWTCPGQPPASGGAPPGAPPPSGCWHWNGIQSAWIHGVCGGDPTRRDPNPPLGRGGTIGIAGDPNDKLGAKGAGTPRYLSGKEPLRYSVLFENIPTASAPAATVTIKDSLNPSTLDLPTLKLGPITFSGQTITPPSVPLSSLGSYTANVNLQPAQNLGVRVTASLDTGTGLLMWTFTTLNPATGLPPDDPLAGFLAPGAEGSVSYSVALKPGATSGSQITNKATIVFDANAPMDTPIWSNTIDITAPTSRVNSLNATSPPSFPLQWTGSDLGSGIGSFDIYASDNGSPFVRWVAQTSATSATYAGILGHTYSFYSIARDLVGNIETSKTFGEATTRIATDATPPVIAPQITGTAGTNGWYRSNVTVTWSFTDLESGIASSTGCATTTLTADTAGVTITCSATNGAGLSTSVPVTIKIDKTSPAISGMPAAGCTLWPVDQKLATVATVTAADVLSGLAPGSLTVKGTTNEPILPTDPKFPDIVITPNGTGGFVVQLRADRLGTANDRIYTLTATANDVAGNTATTTATCTVPHDQGK